MPSRVVLDNTNQNPASSHRVLAKKSFSTVVPIRSNIMAQNQTVENAACVAVYVHQYQTPKACSFIIEETGATYEQAIAAITQVVKSTAKVK